MAIASMGLLFTAGIVLILIGTFIDDLGGWSGPE